MSKFLFVSSYDLRRNTSSNIRTVALMSSLHDEGHIVHCIFIPTNNISDSSIYNNLVKIDRLITYPHIEMQCINKVVNAEGKTTGSFKDTLRSWIIQIYMKFTVYDVYELSFMGLSLNDLKELDDSYDYIVSSAEPRSSHKFAKKIIKLRGYSAKWILYWGDPMTNDVASTKLFHKRERNEERKLISTADLSIYTNPCAVSYMKQKYPDLAAKIDWIPTSDFKKGNDKCDRGDIFKIGYFGDYRQIYRNIEPFYQACLENNFKAVIIGGADKELAPTNTISVYGRMSREDVSKYEKDCGILIVLENISKTGNCIQVPGKLYHYGLTYKYILVITESNNISEEYKRYNRFIFVHNEKQQIAEAIIAIQKGGYIDMSISPVEEFSNKGIAEMFLSKIK